MGRQYAVIMSGPTIDLLALGCSMLAEIPGLPPTGRGRMLQISAAFRAMKGSPLGAMSDDATDKGDSLIASELSEFQIPMPLAIDEIAVRYTRLDGQPLADNRPGEVVAFGAAALDRALREAGRTMPAGGWAFVQQAEKGDKAKYLDSVRGVVCTIERRDVGGTSEGKQGIGAASQSGPHSSKPGRA